MGCTYRYKLRSCLRGERKILEGETSFCWVYMQKFCPCGYHVGKESEDGRRLWQTCNLHPSALFSLFAGSFYPFFVVGSISASPSGEDRWLLTRTSWETGGKRQSHLPRDRGRLSTHPDIFDLQRLWQSVFDCLILSSALPILGTKRVPNIARRGTIISA